MKVPLSRPDITDAEIDAVVAVLRGSQLSLGPVLGQFEECFVQHTGMPHAIAVSSGTAGLHLCVRALGIGPGDEVLVPSFTFIAAANAIRYEGATPVFVDIRADTLNVDPQRLEAAITPRTRAIMAVHTFGLPAPMQDLLALAERYNLLVIEDACEALGSTVAHRPAGSFGHAAVFAFYPNKQITTGEGGMVVTHDAGLAATVRAMRNQGRLPSDDWHQHSMLGFNYRLSEVNAALGVAQMGRLDEILQKRSAVAERYDLRLGSIPGVTLPPRTSPPDRMSWFVYVIRLACNRDRVLQRLAADGVQCGRYFAPIHQQPAYAGWTLPQTLAVTEAESRRTLALPFASTMTHKEIDFVAERLQAALHAL